MQKDLFKKTNPDIPKRWNCCDMLVSPTELAQHIKDYHMKDYQWTDSDRIEIISIVWMLANFITILILQNHD
jgi:hypothetical protein